MIANISKEGMRSPNIPSMVSPKIVKLATPGIPSKR
jgi:hypothetical protein